MTPPTLVMGCIEPSGREAIRATKIVDCGYASAAKAAQNGYSYNASHDFAKDWPFTTPRRDYLSSRGRSISVAQNGELLPAVLFPSGRVYLLPATRRAGDSSGCFGCEGAAPVGPPLPVRAAIVCNMLRSILLKALRGNSLSILRASGTL